MTSEAPAKKKMIVLMSSDNVTFEVEQSVAVLSQTIKHMIEDDCAGATIPLPNVTADTLAKVLEYCKKHAADKKPEDKDKGKKKLEDKDADKLVDEMKKKFDEEFVKVDEETLFGLVLAANYLDIESLLDLTCQTFADNIKDKTPEEVRQIFNIENDYTPEEEAQFRKDNAWAFE